MPSNLYKGGFIMSVIIPSSTLTFFNQSAVTNNKKEANRTSNAEKAQSENTEQTEQSPLEQLRQQRAEEYSRAEEQLERLREQQEKADDEGNKYRDYGKLLKIAMRIMNGDRVPLKDKRMLAEAMPDLYRQAELMKRTDNDRPKKYKSEFEEEKESDPLKQALEGESENSAAEIINAMVE